MDLKGIILSEISQKEKGKYHMISFIYMENETELKIQWIEMNRFMVPGVGMGEGKMGEEDQKVQTSSYKIKKS